MRNLFLVSVLVLTACAGQIAQEKSDALYLKADRFENLPGWNQDNLEEFAPAFQKSCVRMSKANSAQQMSLLPEVRTYEDWQIVCTQFSDVKTRDQIKTFFETHFTPYQVLAGQEKEGLFTGYYEASLKGSKRKSARYSVPLYTRPDDLVMVDLGQFREELKGQRIAGRVRDGNLKPYETRDKIVSGQWPHNDKVLVWVDNAVDAFFVQVQGSGIVELEEGGTMRIGYAGQNGHPYYAIGRELVKRGALEKDSVSMQSIRQWMEENPDQADELMNTNPSYVFFTPTKDEGAKGAEGVVLTPQRSLAVDHALIPYGIPVWLTTDNPQLSRLMMAQDTGGAIRGPVRGDVFWGYGQAAESTAGTMKAKGQYWILLPRHNF